MPHQETVRKIIETIPEMVGVLDGEGKILECNRHLVQNTGYERDELIGIVGPVELVAEGDRERAMREFEKVKANEINLNVPILLKRKNGSVFPTIWSGSILRNEGNDISGYLVTGKDLSGIYELTEKWQAVNEEINNEHLGMVRRGDLSESGKDRYDELKKTCELLSKTEERYRNLYEYSPDLVRSTTDDGTIVDCNANYAKTLGYTKGEVVGKSIFDHTSKRSLKELEDGMDEWKRTGKIATQTIWMRRKDGLEFPALLSGTNLYDDKGRVVGRTVLLKDMTEIYAAKEELETEMAKRLMTIGQLTSRFTHDIRNPLTIIHNASELLKTRNQGMGGKELLPLFEMIDRSISRISYQVDDILNFVRSTDIKKEPCSLLEILNSALAKIRLPHNITVTLPSEDLEVYCDKVKLEVVFENLINNAIQAIDAGKGTIAIKAESQAGFDAVEVSDSGPGIPAGILPQIFEPLFTTKRSGTGLGLTTCKNLVEQHGWTIQARLPSTFIIRIPRGG